MKEATADFHFFKQLHIWLFDCTRVNRGARGGKKIKQVQPTALTQSSRGRSRLSFCTRGKTKMSTNWKQIRCSACFFLLRAAIADGGKVAAHLLLLWLRKKKQPKNARTHTCTVVCARGRAPYISALHSLSARCANSDGICLRKNRHSCWCLRD